MKYKPGDEVFIKAEITDVSGYECSERPYFVAPDICSVNWVSEDKIIPMGKTYSDGLNDAWELADKVYEMRNQQRYDVFGTESLAKVMDLSPQEAIAKIEACEKEKEIKVGDVVKSNVTGYEAVVSAINNDEVFVIYNDGSCGQIKINVLTKTGKHIDIESLLRQIGE